MRNITYTIDLEMHSKKVLAPIMFSLLPENIEVFALQYGNIYDDVRFVIKHS